MGRARDRASADLNGQEFILDADADTSISADTDDQIDIKIAGADDFQFTANTFTAQSGSTIAAQALTATTITTSSTIDVNGNELILDADADTSITADTDDQVDIKVGGTDTVVIKPDEMILQGPHPSFTLTDSDDTNGGGIFYSNGSLSVSADTGNTGATGIISFQIDGNEDVKIDGGGDLTINDGNLVIGTSGHGIDFSATSNGTGVSNQSEILTDYEKGNFTATLTGTSGSAGSVAGNTGTWTYVKVGNMVHINGSVAITNVGSYSGTVQITGLPFTQGANHGMGLGVTFHNFNSRNDASANIKPKVNAGTAILAFTKPDTTPLNYSEIGTGYIGVGGVYPDFG